MGVVGGEVAENASFLYMNKAVNRTTKLETAHTQRHHFDRTLCRCTWHRLLRRIGSYVHLALCWRTVLGPPEKFPTGRLPFKVAFVKGAQNSPFPPIKASMAPKSPGIMFLRIGGLLRNRPRSGVAHNGVTFPRLSDGKWPSPAFRTCLPEAAENGHRICSVCHRAWWAPKNAGFLSWLQWLLLGPEEYKISAKVVQCVEEPVFQSLQLFSLKGR